MSIFESPGAETMIREMRKVIQNLIPHAEFSGRNGELIEEARKFL